MASVFHYTQAFEGQVLVCAPGKYQMTLTYAFENKIFVTFWRENYKSPKKYS